MRWGTLLDWLEFNPPQVHHRYARFFYWPYRDRHGSSRQLHFSTVHRFKIQKILAGFEFHREGFFFAEFDTDFRPWWFAAQRVFQIYGKLSRFFYSYIPAHGVFDIRPVADVVGALALLFELGVGCVDVAVLGQEQQRAIGLLFRVRVDQLHGAFKLYRYDRVAADRFGRKAFDVHAVGLIGPGEDGFLIGWEFCEGDLVGDGQNEIAAVGPDCYVEQDRPVFAGGGFAPEQILYQG